MDTEEIWDKGVEISIGYTGSVGAILWSKISKDCSKLVLGLCRSFCDLD
jgi:hypothetical protein